MRHRTARRTVVAALGFVVIGLGLALGLAACRTGAARADEPIPTTATLHVENRAFADRVIYILQNGVRRRLGMAPGHTTTELTIPAMYLVGAAPMRFLADPIGGNDAPVTEEIAVFPGDDVVLVIVGT